MGIFLSISGVINKRAEEVETSLRKFATNAEGGLLGEEVEEDHPNLAIISEHGQHTTVLYPNDFIEWDDASAFLSLDLQTSVFSFHIHDEDLWMFQLFHKGQLVSRFNPVPDYWQDVISDQELQSWQGNAPEIVQYVSGLSAATIEKYFVRWDDLGEEDKAYPDDEFEYGDCWQIVDFMAKLGMEYPIDEEGNVYGRVYKLWTKQLKLEDD
ncbi:hypothetical protein Q0590_17360 [Rhodocytophaga aerolata]|uniref:Uncharacterized protein n=1 Tax=Rhodocytophaga aerolata TaxID=455078 RepID=A0ABT8RBG0_9BACT|nr:hypothetical protein [Rhodocytophaga aerolata]MDO1448045.1 hypothetical protein [Rhodocytophaga aerolata]